MPACHHESAATAGGGGGGGVDVEKVKLKKLIFFSLYYSHNGALFSRSILDFWLVGG